MKDLLKDYINNGRNRIPGLQVEIRKAVADENFVLAGTIKGMLVELQNTLYRLQRIADGLPAFQDAVNDVSQYDIT